MRRARVAVYLHLVWATWDRQLLLQGDLQRRVHRAIAAKCEELRAEVIALGGVEDHAHLLVGLPLTMSLSELVKRIKGATSRQAGQEFIGPDEFFKWQGAYGAFSVSPRHLNEVASYIARQREHHALGSIIAAWEPDPNEPEDEEEYAAR
jgi:putative transposase